MRYFPLLLALLACRSDWESEPTEKEYLLDADADGFDRDEDCNDSDASIFPGSEELCDGIDNDCDDEIDEGVKTTYYVDADEDGFGSADIITEACELPEGFVGNGSDCNDSNADAYPSAEEVCDGIDNDCNGVVDEGQGEFYHVDADGDGYGDPELTEQFCNLPVGYSTNGDDCDDSNPAASPAQIEVCDSADNNCDGVVDEDTATDAATWYQDGDGDGYGSADFYMDACTQPTGFVVNDIDCDDVDPNAYPGADELCNGVDDDCDGLVDDDAIDASTWYEDGDSDGFGSVMSMLVACVQPPGYLSDNTDCDDNDDDIHPGANEVCNGEDDDCNGDIDGDAIDLSTWYADGDGDGYGGASAQLACTQPTGFVSMAGDCDDSAAGVSPAATEVCDGLDNDCDGTTDESDSSDALIWYADGDGDGYGDSGAMVEACSQPGGYVSDFTDCDDNDDDVHPGAVEICNGDDEDCDGDIDELGAINGSVWYFDGDGDGFGTPNDTLEACEQPIHYTSNDSDCDDSDADVNPSASEVCNGDDDDCDGDIDEDSSNGATWYADGDGDGYGDDASEVVGCSAPLGYISQGGDCDDANPSASPIGVELCDGADNDCNGSADDAALDALMWYADSDGDNYGNPSSSVEACDQPVGYLSNSADCNDSDSMISPAATESCNSIDDDCDGDIDESSASDASTWYADFDGDGYGDAAVSLNACTQPANYTADATDCDDNDDDVYPNAIEMCNSEDDDCDNDIDESGALGEMTWYTDNDNDGYGDDGTATVSCFQPLGMTAVSGDCNDNDDQITPVALEYCDGVDNNCDGFVDEPTATDVATWYRDVDGDGFGSSATDTQSCDQPTGYVTDDTDCDDLNGAVNPGEVETCDGVDNDCDGDVDDANELGFADYFPDVDGDGFGNPLAGVNACEQPIGYVVDNTDCDDLDSDVNPAESEVCDDLDNDCDGDIDDADTLVYTNYFADADGDGYGDAGDSINACAAPVGYISDNTDCDDSNLDINPATGCGADCLELYNAGNTTDGEYLIDPDGYGVGEDPIRVYCDMTTDGGGWTLCASLTKGYVPSHMLHDEDLYAFQARLNGDDNYVYELDSPVRTTDSWNNSETLNYGQFCRHMDSAGVSESRYHAKLYNWHNNYGASIKNQSYDGVYSGIFNDNIFTEWFSNSSSNRSFGHVSGDNLYVQDNNGYGGPYITPNIGLTTTSNQTAPYTHSTNAWGGVGSASCVGCTSSGNGYETLPYGQTAILNNLGHSFWSGIPNLPHGWSDCTLNGNCDYHESGMSVWLFWTR